MVSWLKNNMPKLDNEGMRFNHCISNSPVNTPYRGILLTGQHPLYCGAMQNDLQILPGHGNYFGEALPGNVAPASCFVVFFETG